jgi:hypothetical protein
MAQNAATARIASRINKISIESPLVHAKDGTGAMIGPKTPEAISTDKLMITGWRIGHFLTY